MIVEGEEIDATRDDIPGDGIAPRSAGPGDVPIVSLTRDKRVFP